MLSRSAVVRAVVSGAESVAVAAGLAGAHAVSEALRARRAAAWRVIVMREPYTCEAAEVRAVGSGWGQTRHFDRIINRFPADEPKPRNRSFCPL